MNLDLITSGESNYGGTLGSIQFSVPEHVCHIRAAAKAWRYDGMSFGGKNDVQELFSCVGSSEASGHHNGWRALLILNIASGPIGKVVSHRALTSNFLLHTFASLFDLSSSLLRLYCQVWQAQRILSPLTERIVTATE